MTVKFQSEIHADSISFCSKKSLLLFLLLAVPDMALANDEITQLMDMSIEDLSHAEVTVSSLARKEQQLMAAPAAVYIITEEQIQRSGARTVAEALVLAPGLHVTRLSEANWSVSARGANDSVSNKLLVTVDGRSVFNPVNSGVAWGHINTLMADIKRIEVLLGPAGTFWGGNAVNGVVNVITKSAEESIGTYVEVMAGGEGDSEVGFRYAAQLNQNTFAKMVLQAHQSEYTDKEDFEWNSYNTSFRIEQIDNLFDWNITGSVFRWEEKYEKSVLNTENITVAKRPGDDFISGGYFVLNSSHNINNGVFSVNAWGDVYNFELYGVQGNYNNLDLDIYYRHPVFSNSEVVLGIGSRLIDLELQQNTKIIIPNDSAYSASVIYDVFDERYFNHDIYGQIETKITDSLTSFIGAKFEYFGLVNRLEVQPHLRISYDLNEQHQLWAGVGRAVVTPSTIDVASSEDSEREAGLYEEIGPIFGITRGDKELETESVVSFDMGHRYVVSNDLRLSSSFFLSRYEHFRGLGNQQNNECSELLSELVSQSPSQCQVNNLRYTDSYNAKAWGAELSADWTPVPSFKLYGNYTYKHTSIWCEDASECGAYDVESEARQYPQHIVSMQAMWDVTSSIQWDFVFKWVSEEGGGFDNNGWEQIATLDTRVAWQYKSQWPRLELLVDGVFQSPYVESYQSEVEQIEQEVFLKMVWDI